MALWDYTVPVAIYSSEPRPGISDLLRDLRFLQDRFGWDCRILPPAVDDLPVPMIIPHEVEYDSDGDSIPDLVSDSDLDSDIGDFLPLTSRCGGG